VVYRYDGDLPVGDATTINFLSEISTETKRADCIVLMGVRGLSLLGCSPKWNLFSMSKRSDGIADGNALNDFYGDFDGMGWPT